MSRGEKEFPVVLSAFQVEEYWDKGFVMEKGVITHDEIVELKRECRQLWARFSDDQTNVRLQRKAHVNGDMIADRIDPVADISPLFQRFAEDQRVLGAATAVLGGESELFKFKLISKWPGMTGYGMHQDYTYWSFVGDIPFDHFVSVLIPLDEFNAESGATELFPQLHDRKLPPPANNPDDVDESKMDLSTGVILEMEPGDMALFHGMTPHRSAVNSSDHNRESLFITYVRTGHGDLLNTYYENRPHGWLES